MSVKSLLFTKEALSEIEIPKIKRDVYKDTREKGLLLIVSYGGSKVFYLGTVISKKYYRIKIASFPGLSVTEARAKTVELKNKIAKGYNPLEAKTKLSNEPTFKELYDKYLNDWTLDNALPFNKFLNIKK